MERTRILGAPENNYYSALAEPLKHKGISEGGIGGEGVKNYEADVVDENPKVDINNVDVVGAEPEVDVNNVDHVDFDHEVNGGVISRTKRKAALDLLVYVSQRSE